MQPLQLFKQSGGPDLGRGLQHRHEFIEPDFGERIRTRPVAPSLALAGKNRFGFDAPTGALAEPGPCRSGGLGISVLA